MREKTELPDSYSYTLNEPNICVLDLATWQIGDEPVQPLTEILKIDRAVRTHFNLPWRGGGMLQPWYAEKHKGQEYTKPLGVLKMNFPFSMSVVPRRPLPKRNFSPMISHLTPSALTSICSMNCSAVRLAVRWSKWAIVT